MKSKLAEEIKLIARLSLMIPTAVMLTTPALWWAVEPIKVFAAYLVSARDHRDGGSAGHNQRVR